jgi:hypothetical protein
MSNCFSSSIGSFHVHSLLENVISDDIQLSSSSGECDQSFLESGRVAAVQPLFRGSAQEKRKKTTRAIYALLSPIISQQNRYSGLMFSAVLSIPSTVDVLRVVTLVVTPCEAASFMEAYIGQ